MSSRFTSTEKWEDKWFRSLDSDAKLLFLYICDKCDLGGFWEIDLDLASFFTGIPESKIKQAFEALSRGYLGADNTIWLKNFIKHQRNLPLNYRNNAHKHIISLLKSHSEFENDFIHAFDLGAKQGLSKHDKPPCKGKGISRGKGNVEVKVEEKPVKSFSSSTKGGCKGGEQKLKAEIEQRFKFAYQEVCWTCGINSGIIGRSTKYNALYCDERKCKQNAMGIE